MPIIDPDAGCNLSCLCFVCLIDILFAVLYFVTWEDIFLYILIAIDVPLGIYIRCNSCLNDPNKALQNKITIWRNLDSFFIMVMDKRFEYPFENIKGFSNLNQDGKGIYLELVSGHIIKCASCNWEDPIIDKIVLELNNCLDKLRIKEALIPSNL